MKPIWIVLLCLLGAAALAVLVWLLVWYVEQRVLAKSLGRVPEGADAQAAWEQHVLRKQGWTADSEQGRAALARARRCRGHAGAAARGCSPPRPTARACTRGSTACPTPTPRSSSATATTATPSMISAPSSRRCMPPAAATCCSSTSARTA
ncbi:MAG: hypothetical protein ACLRRN_04450 [Oscillospiraceae bacterium]